jgi:hypothetical protein
VALSREQVRVPTKVAPKKKPIVQTQKAVEAPATPVPQPAVTPPEVVAQPPMPLSPPKLFFDQPGLPSAPPAPPDDLPAPVHFEDMPGGNVVVLAVQLNSDNHVIATDILVASSTPLNDLAFALSTNGMEWKDVDPPIPPGQYRWIEVRLDYTNGQNKSSVLP